jgi:NAD(P)-dependent dehydrogenase (short-subunit alcohol dehydrogenase family)
VNAVIPGLVETDMVVVDMQSQAERLGKHLNEIRAIRAGEMFLRRLQEADSTAAAVEFLVSEDARDITGHCLSVTGGPAGA